MKKIFVLITTLSIVISNFTMAQLPDFIKRLDNGSTQLGNFSEKVKFQLSENRMYINSVVDGKNYKLLIDTYSPCLFYDYILNDITPDTLDRSNLLGKAFEKTFLLPIYPKFDTVKIGSVSFLDIGAMLMKSDSSNPLLKYNIDGILGANLMKKSIWQLNFKDTVTMITNEIKNLQYTDNANKLSFTPKPVQGSPNVIIGINGDTVSAEFDTGNDGFINALSPSILKKIKNGEAIPWKIKLDIPINRNDLDSIETHYYVLIDSIRIGNMTYYEMPIIAYNPDILKDKNKGSLGVSFMKNFITTIDWLHNNIYLEQISALPQNKITFGFTCELKNNKLLVKSIFESSVAADMGLDIGDVVVEINGKNVKYFNKDSLKKFSSHISNPKLDDEIIKLTISKNGTLKYIEVESYELF